MRSTTFEADNNVGLALGLSTTRKQQYDFNRQSGLVSAVSESDDQGAGDAASPAKPAPVKAPVPSPANKGWLAFWERSKPYREIAAALAAVISGIVAISGGVAWIVAHFATQTQLHHLECRVTNNILTQLLPI